jgi:hypothetical protein
MSPLCRSFVEGLHRLNPDDDGLESELFDLCLTLDEEPTATEVIPSIFEFIEAHPNADHGSPGPLVHFLESHPGYEEPLVASVKKGPAPHTVWMVGRILNVKLTPERRAFFLDLLRSVLTNPNSDEIVKDHAERILERQSSR